MICAHCGRENRPGRKFCAECGRWLEIRCAGCGARSEHAERFCGECGKPLAEPASFPEPRSYTPRHLAEKILTSRGALEGERKQVTVLFADLKGSMDLSESIDAEEWHGVMEYFFKILTDGVHRFEGTVNQYTGDGIMALFGAPIAHEDHAARASGAKSYEPFPHVERAELARLLGDDAARRRELREAHRLFLQIGAPIRAEQVAKELAG